MSPSVNTQANVIEVLLFRRFNQLQGIDDLLDIDNIYIEGIIDKMYPKELQLSKANSSDTEFQFHISSIMHRMFDIYNAKVTISSFIIGFR